MDPPSTLRCSACLPDPSFWTSSKRFCDQTSARTRRNRKHAWMGGNSRINSGLIHRAGDGPGCFPSPCLQMQIHIQRWAGKKANVHFPKQLTSLHRASLLKTTSNLTCVSKTHTHTHTLVKSNSKQTVSPHLLFSLHLSSFVRVWPSPARSTPRLA